MLRPQNIGTLLLIGLAAEVAAFIGVVDWLGFGPAFLIGVGSTVLGLARLRQVGTSAFGQLRAMAERGGREDAFIDGALSTLGAVLLILPGFVTDAVGLALLAPSWRQWVRGRIGVAAGPLAGPRAERLRGAESPRAIDLDAQDWSRLDRSRPK